MPLRRRPSDPTTKCVFLCTFLAPQKISFNNTAGLEYLCSVVVSQLMSCLSFSPLQFATDDQFSVDNQNKFLRCCQRASPNSFTCAVLKCSSSSASFFHLEMMTYLQIMTFQNFFLTGGRPPPTCTSLGLGQQNLLFPENFKLAMTQMNNCTYCQFYQIIIKSLFCNFHLDSPFASIAPVASPLSPVIPLIDQLVGRLIILNNRGWSINNCGQL